MCRERKPELIGEICRELAKLGRKVRSNSRGLFLSIPGVPRSRDEVLSFFDGFELVEPGLVQVPDWRPDEGILHDVPWWGGIARRLDAGSTDV